MAETLSGARVAILVENGFEQSELAEPKKQLESAGAIVDIVSPQDGSVKGWQKKQWGDSFDVDVSLDAADADDYQCLVLPGGQINPDVLRTNKDAVAFIRSFVDAGKLVAAICHGPWTLIEADAVRGRKMTSYHSIQTDMRNAGAEWVDEEVVTDGNFITSRNPGDLNAFCRTIIETLERSVTRAGAAATEQRPSM